MTFFELFLCTVGVTYLTGLFFRFIRWIDGRAQ